jgi:hypothetical protein
VSTHDLEEDLNEWVRLTLSSGPRDGSHAGSHHHRLSRDPLEFFGSHGIEAKRPMIDYAFAYAKNRSLRELLVAEGIRHLLTQPYLPQTLVRKASPAGR